MRPIKPSAHKWANNVRPTIDEHLRELAELVDSAPQIALRRAADLFEGCVALHHQLLLPARHVISEFLDASTARPIDPDRAQLPFAVLALIGVDLPVLRGVTAVLDSSANFSDREMVEKFGNIAPDGDGSGIAIDGWLDSTRYLNVTRSFLARAGVSEKTIARQVKLRARRRHIAEATLLAAHPRMQRAALQAKMREAREASDVSEYHGPLMHAYYVPKEKVG